MIGTHNLSTAIRPKHYYTHDTNLFISRLLDSFLGRIMRRSPPTIVICTVPVIYQ
jgi:hypothetical protein